MFRKSDQVLQYQQVMGANLVLRLSLLVANQIAECFLVIQSSEIYK